MEKIEMEMPITNEIKAEATGYVDLGVMLGIERCISEILKMDELGFPVQEKIFRKLRDLKTKL